MAIRNEFPPIEWDLISSLTSRLITRIGYPLRPHANSEMQQRGTYTDYKAAVLQRLANPTEPYHVAINPYITVDWTTIDLTVFNGDDYQNRSGYGGGDPYDFQDDGTGPDVRFSSRQRGPEYPAAMVTTPIAARRAPYAAAPPLAPGPQNHMLWSPNTAEPLEFSEYPREAAPPYLYFRFNLVHSLGFLNGNMGVGQPPPVVTAAPDYAGAPERPFPWLTWNNRPFANPFELMQVPASSPARLPFEFGVHRDTAGTLQSTDDPYDSVLGPVVPPLPAPNPVDRRTSAARSVTY